MQRRRAICLLAGCFLLCSILRPPEPKYTPGDTDAAYSYFMDVTASMLFMNYGQLTFPMHPCVETAIPFQRVQANMYLRLANETLLSGRHVLEVGSGRGAGAWLLTNCHCPARYVGLDFNAQQVAQCNAQVGRLGATLPLAFVEGSAGALPFPDASFDVVLSVEAAHAFEDFARFAVEARRVLRPGGSLLLADVLPFREGFPLQGPAALRAALAEAFGGSVEATDISQRVCQAREYNAQFWEEWDKSPGIHHLSFVREFAAAPGSDQARKLCDGRLPYFSYRCLAEA